MKIELFEKIDPLKLAQLAYDSVVQFDDWYSAKGILLAIVLAVFAFFSFAWGAEKFISLTSKLVDSIKKSGLPLPWGNNKRVQITLRQQFCRVLRTDLEKIASGENWSDQWFTDLEAEVEAEGGYFLSPLHKLFRRPITGARKEPSLMQAITRSSERCLLLVGDPGSGKSVALRHLALELAETGVKSREKELRVPLYINLREFIVNDPYSVNADTVKAFVLDHVRRGDSSSAQYIHANWDEFLAKGTWYFLFDSFDEIPAVLHAEKGSRVIHRFSEAVRQFMDGMGECRGILASREFKGPEALPWQKLRILPLDNKRQLELIRNSALTAEQSSIVRSQLAASHNAIFKNPLFLSLLCRFVKEHKAAPEHNHALLMDHLEQLARRDFDWVKEKYKLAPEDLIQGAERIASFLAQEENVGLAPTFVELSRALTRKGYKEKEALNLINALVYVKIGRNDVKEARQGDRRFAFAHRRYQESLFVKYLVRNPKVLNSEELLLNPKWREYTVALLQSQSIATCGHLLAIAAQLILKWAEGHSISVEPGFVASGGYFEWDATREVHLLNLLQEGLSQRHEIVPSELSAAIEAFVSKRWAEGDTFDQMKVIELGGLVPAGRLEQRISQALESHVDELIRASFMKVAYLQNVPIKLATWVRKRIANEVLVARDAIELSKLDLLVARLPSELGAQRIFNRNCLLRNLLYRPFKWFFDGMVKAARFINTKLGGAVRDDTDARVDWVTTTSMSVLLPTVLINALVILFPSSNTWSKMTAALILAMALSLICRIIWRDSPQIVTPQTVVRSICKTGWGGMRTLFSLRVAHLLIIFLFPILVAFLIWKFKSAVILFFAVIITSTMLLGVSWKMMQTRRSLSYFAEVSARQSSDPVVLAARTNSELFAWLSYKKDQLLLSESIARSLLKMLDCLPCHNVDLTRRYPIFDARSSDKFSRCKNQLMRKLVNPNW